MSESTIDVRIRGTAEEPIRWYLIEKTSRTLWILKNTTWTIRKITGDENSKSSQDFDYSEYKRAEEEWLKI